ncbi:hypothetical protein CC80DRAFT_61328 [Byssothecium circinans]|uniref:Uncharacterized protein n=1 Tax=Byssothecium circinans TaxID=147558 RepID=A0A6A5TWA3_9PLEO|nr:hypothetical protein CC80DRAFT_61328 [Byssothecium circinans]
MRKLPDLWRGAVEKIGPGWEHVVLFCRLDSIRHRCLAVKRYYRTDLFSDVKQVFPDFYGKRVSPTGWSGFLLKSVSLERQEIEFAAYANVCWLSKDNVWWMGGEPWKTGVKPCSKGPACHMANPRSRRTCGCEHLWWRHVSLYDPVTKQVHGPLAKESKYPHYLPQLVKDKNHESTAKVDRRPVPDRRSPGPASLTKETVAWCDAVTQKIEARYATVNAEPVSERRGPPVVSIPSNLASMKAMLREAMDDAAEFERKERMHPVPVQSEPNPHAVSESNPAWLNTIIQNVQDRLAQYECSSSDHVSRREHAGTGGYDAAPSRHEVSQSAATQSRISFTTRDTLSASSRFSSTGFTVSTDSFLR